jgi:hypothetical protein
VILASLDLADWAAFAGIAAAGLSFVTLPVIAYQHEEILSDPTPLVRNAMDAIWQGFGLERCHLFDAEGRWLGD